MLIIRLRALHLSACPWKFGLRQTRVITSAPDCAGVGCGAQTASSVGEQRGQAATAAFPPSARKGSNSKTNVFITPNRSTGQGILPLGGVSVCSGNSGRRPAEISHFTKVPATLQWSCRPSISQWRESSLPASPGDTGTRPEPGPQTSSQPTPATGGRALRLGHPHLVTKVLSKPGVWAKGENPSGRGKGRSVWIPMTYVYEHPV